MITKCRRTCRTWRYPWQRRACINGTNILFTGTAAGQQVQNYINQGIGVVGTLPPGGASAVTVFVDGRSQNLGVSRTKGIDFTASLHGEFGRG